MTQKQKNKQKEKEIINLAQKLCREKISEEYALLAEKMVRKLGRKREVPFVRGKSEIWAAAVVQAIGSINFLGDKSFLPYLSLDDLCGFYKLNKSTVGAKSGQLRKLLKLESFDDEFSTEYMKENNPFNQLKMTDDGFLYLDEDDPGMDIEEIMDVFPNFDKAAIFVKPKQPFIDWVNKLDPENPMSLEDFFEGNTYLVPDEEEDIVEPADIDLFMARYYIDIVENELSELWTNTDDWPDSFSFDMFKQWFEYHVSTMIYNL
ncbi:MAG: DUF6398 domain-containing protein [Bacteroidota bacterium]|nr:DUF6398 domain-containing protein [Bacteroidota bacterium]